MKKRADFLAVRGGKRVSTAGFLIEAKARRSAAPTSAAARFGYTVTKKLGGAVIRNRIRRRLKAAVAGLAADRAAPGFDYVLVARQAAETRPFASLCADLERAFDTLHGAAKRSSTRPEA